MINKHKIVRTTLTLSIVLLASCATQTFAWKERKSDEKQESVRQQQIESEETGAKLSLAERNRPYDVVEESPDDVGVALTSAGLTVTDGVLPVSSTVTVENPPYVPGVKNPVEFIIDELPKVPDENAGNWVHKRLWELQKNPACVRAGRGGCKVRFRCGAEYTTAEPIVMCRSMHLIGCGSGGGWDQSTKIKQTNKAAEAVFKVAFATQCRAPVEQGGYGMPGGDGSWSTFEGFEISGAGIAQIDHVNKPQWGIWADGMPVLRNVYIHDVSMGIKAVASAKNKNGWITNVNLFRWDNVLIYTTAGPGLLCDGPDCNAGVASGLNVTYACQRASPELISKYGLKTCAAIYDSGFLGNTYIGAHTAATYWVLPIFRTMMTLSAVSADVRARNGGINRMVTFTVPEGHGYAPGFFAKATGTSCLTAGNYWVDSVTPTTVTFRDHLKTCPVGALPDGEGTFTAIRQYFPGFYMDPSQKVAHNVCLGCYAEEDQTVSIMNAATHVFGGLSAWEGEGTQIQKGITNRLTVLNAKWMPNVGRLDLGENCNYPGCVLQVQPNTMMAEAYPFLLFLDPKTQTLKSLVAAQVSQFEVGLSKTSPFGLGYLKFPTTPVYAGKENRVIGLVVP